MEKTTKYMHDPAERIPDPSKDGALAPPGSFAKRLWQRLVEVWIFLTILTFFVIRVLGSQAFQRILGRFVHRHLP
jgi:hypothetical protein